MNKQKAVHIEQSPLNAPKLNEPPEQADPAQKEDSSPIKTKKKVYPPRKLTFKQEQFAQRFVKNRGNATQAVIEVYPPKKHNVARAIASENLTKPAVLNRIDQILNENKLTLNECVVKLHRQTEAQKKTEFGIQPDNPTINDALKTAFKLHRVLSDSNVNIDARSINIGLDSADHTALQGICDTLKDMNSKLSMGNVQSGEVIDVTYSDT